MRYNDLAKLDNGDELGFYLRDVDMTDKDLIYEWANDEVTRQNSFCTEFIEYDTHCKWLENLLERDDRKQYILMCHDNRLDFPVGQVRIDFDRDRGEISYSIAPQYRGNGLGQVGIRLCIAKVRKDYPEINKLVALVKPTNVASVKTFLNLGFEEEYREYSVDLSRCDFKEEKVIVNMSN